MDEVVKDLRELLQMLIGAILAWLTIAKEAFSAGPVAAAQKLLSKYFNAQQRNGSTRCASLPNNLKDASAQDAWIQQMIAAGVPVATQTYCAVALNLAKTSEPLKAEKLLSQMPTNHSSSHIYQAVIEAYIRNNNMRSARACLARMEESGNPKPDVACYNTFIDAAAKLGDVVSAERWMSHLTKCWHFTKHCELQCCH